MRNIDPPDPAVRSVLHDATVALRDIAVTIDRASAVLDPTMELLEASHAIHRALIVFERLLPPQGSGPADQGSGSARVFLAAGGPDRWD